MSDTPHPTSFGSVPSSPQSPLGATLGNHNATATGSSASHSGDSPYADSWPRTPTQGASPSYSTGSHYPTGSAASAGEGGPTWGGNAASGSSAGFGGGAGNSFGTLSGHSGGQQPPSFPPGGNPGSYPGGYPGWPMCPYAKRPWRKRHPVLFWLVFILLFSFLGNALYQSQGVDSPWAGPKVAVVNISGMILDSADVVNWVEKIQKDASVIGVLVRVDSPGGAVTPSQEMYMALERLAKVKPVVTSMGTVAASGGYYVALPGKRIFAAPATLTGSIGVKMEIPNAEGLFGMIGLSSTTLASGELKDAGSPFRAITPQEREYFLGVIMDMYEDFVAAVAKHRNLTPEDVKKVADGRALTGRQALAVGLVDELGDQHDALEHLYSLCNVTGDDVQIMHAPEEKVPFIKQLLESALRVTLEQKATAQQPVFMY